MTKKEIDGALKRLGNLRMDFDVPKSHSHNNHSNSAHQFQNSSQFTRSYLQERLKCVKLVQRFKLFLQMFSPTSGLKIEMLNLCSFHI